MQLHGPVLWEEAGRVGQGGGQGLIARGVMLEFNLFQCSYSILENFKVNYSPNKISTTPTTETCTIGDRKHLIKHDFLFGRSDVVGSPSKY